MSGFLSYTVNIDDIDAVIVNNKDVIEKGKSIKFLLGQYGRTVRDYLHF